MRLAFLGDVYLSDEVLASREENERFDLFGDVRNRVGPDGLIVANVEFALSERPSPHPFKWATLCSSPALAEQLKPVSVAVVANNHAGDAGVAGLKDTVANLEKAGIKTLGYGNSLEQALDPCIIESEVGKVGIVALCCLTTNSQSIATHTEPGIPPISVQTLRRAINKARKEADFVIVFLHWGCEQSPYPVPDQVRLGRLAIDAGADAVVGCHAHVIQTYEKYKDCWIFHGIGNYFFSPVDARSFQDGRFVKNVKINHAAPNRESLVPVFEIRAGKLELVELLVTGWEGNQAPSIKDGPNVLANLKHINARLERWLAWNARKLRRTEEPVFHCKLHNGVVAYYYSKPPIHRDWSMRDLASRAYRRLQREFAGIRRATQHPS
ncbi:CapA family protein [Microvirga terrae]|uniref:CapA family protein n=1 Tax=Microvirga terrae TaxID=2740529 RepID=A0ABY5RN01_9HYPH|nr:CapA family protein [Microvirga terrae]UVF17607.1 CapA family protein [Microvirga terrae]